MKAGLLNKKIYILKPFVSTSEFGENSTNYIVTSSTRACVKMDNNNRTESNSELLYEVTVTFTVRDYVEVDEWCRIKYDGKEYRILSLLKDDNRRAITILTEQVNE